jgi:hypothetical protein
MSELLAAWIKQNVTPAKSICLVWPARSLKHECSLDLGVTVRHADFQAEMIDAGFEPVAVKGRADGPFYRMRAFKVHRR